MKITGFWWFVALFFVIVLRDVTSNIVRRAGTCSIKQQQQACDLLWNSNVVLATAHASLKIDGATARDNLRDMCNGGRARLSSYSCRECRAGAPGGSVCVSTKVLDYLQALASKGLVKVNELVGACHSCRSKHYLGLAVDLDDGPRDSEFINKCRSLGGTGLDETNHIHCQFS